MTDWERLTRRSALGLVAVGATVTVGETLGFADVLAERGVSVEVTEDANGLLSLSGYVTADTATTLTNRLGELMTVEVDSTDSTARFDVGETGNYESNPDQFEIPAGDDESVAVRGNGGAGGTVPVAVTASFASGLIELTREFAVPATEVTISDLQFDPNGNDKNKLDEEYVTFENTGSAAVELNGWYVEDEGSNHTYDFPPFTLSTGEAVTLRTGIGNDDPDSDPDADLYWGESQSVWNNDGDTAFLYRPGGRLEAQASQAPGGGGGSNGFTIDGQASQFEAPDPENDNLDEEYVVFKNTGGSSIDLKNWVVEDEVGQDYKFGKFTLDSGNTVTLRTGTGNDDPDSDPDANLYWGRGGAVWNNTGDTVFVYDGPSDNATEVASYSY
jgi:hypothetical protein